MQLQTSPITILLPSIGQCHIPMAPASASSSHVFQNNNQQRHHQILRRTPRTVNENEHERGRWHLQPRRPLNQTMQIQIVIMPHRRYCRSNLRETKCSMVSIRHLSAMDALRRIVRKKLALIPKLRKKHPLDFLSWHHGAPFHHLWNHLTENW